MVMTVLFHDAAHSLCVSETRESTDVIVNSIQFWFVPVLRVGPSVILFYQFSPIVKVELVNRFLLATIVLWN